MRTVGTFDARTHFSQLLDLVERGETVTITRNGKPVAILAPVDHPEAAVFDEIEQFRGTHRLADVSPRDLVEEGRRW